MEIAYRDLSVNDTGLRSELVSAVEKVLAHGRIILGPEVEAFEKKIAMYCKKKWAVGVGSGTCALYLALRSLGVGFGDEVITTPLSWIATFNAITLCGADPVIVDINEDLNINPELIPMAITRRTKAIIPVHFTGRMCNMTRINEIASEHGLFVVEDAAQAFGAHKDGNMAGSFGHVNCFSMNPMKVFGGYGEAGAVVTDDNRIYEKLLSLRYAGTVDKEDCHFPSLNGRIDTIQAAMLLIQFKYLNAKIEKHRQIATYYTESLKNIVTCPWDDDSYHIYYSYTILTEMRDDLKRYLSSKGIETKIQHPILMPYHSAYRNMEVGEMPIAERLVNRILCIPNHEKLTTGETEYIVKSIKEFFMAG